MRPSVKFSFLIALLLCQIFVYMASLLTVEGNTCRSSELFVCVCQMPACSALLSRRGEANYNKSKACHIIAKCGRDSKLCNSLLIHLPSTLAQFCHRRGTPQKILLWLAKEGEKCKEKFSAVFCRFSPGGNRANLSEKQVSQMVLRLTQLQWNDHKCMNIVVGRVYIWLSVT